MNKNRLVKIGLGILAGVLMVLVSIVSFKAILPVGTFTVPLAEIFAVGAIFSLGSVPALVVTVLAAGVMILLGTSDWVGFFTMIITTLIISRLVNWQVSLKVKIPQQQLIVVGIITGITQLVIAEIGAVIIGWFFNDQLATGWAFAGALLTLESLAALVTAVLVPPAVMASRWLTRQLVTDDSSHDDDDDNGSVVIDLSKHDHDKK